LFTLTVNGSLITGRALLQALSACYITL